MYYDLDMHNIVTSLDIEQLNDLVKYLVTHDPGAHQLVLEWYKGTLGPTQSTLKQEISTRLDDASLFEYWECAAEIISRFNELGGGPYEEEDEAYDWLCKIQEVIEKGNISYEAKIEFMDEAFVEYDAGNSGFGDSLTDIFFELCQTEEEWRYLVKKFESQPSEWRVNLIMSILRDKLKDDDAYLELRLKRLEYGMDYYDLTDFYADRGDIKKAVETALSGLLYGKGRISDLLYFLFDHYAGAGDTDNVERIVDIALEGRNEEKGMLEKLFDYYRSQDEYEKARDALLKSFPYARDGYLEYKQIRDYLKREDWDEVEPGLFESLRDKNLIAYLKVCMEKGLKAEVMDILLNSPVSSEWWSDSCKLDRFAACLEEEFPEKVIEYYWQKAYHNIPGGKRSTYQVANSYLERVRDIYLNILKEDKVWYDRINSLKTEFKGRPAFLDETRGL